MKTKFLLFCIFSTFAGISQKSGIFAVTDVTPGGVSWMNIRDVSNLKDGGSMVLRSQGFEGSITELQTQQKRSVSTGIQGSGNDLPMNTGVAALAYDGSHERLYFGTMFTGDLRYISTNKNSQDVIQIGNIYASVPRVNNVPVSPTNQGPVITRMTSGSDGYVYGLSNDGETFFRVSTSSKKPSIENLGSLVDDPSNGAMSVHASCSSWGGDMVATDNGELYVFSMYQHVFKVDISTRVATYLGKISGLSPEFTVNGVAVQDDGSVIISSSILPGQVGIITDAKELKAEMKSRSGWVNSSDLASSHVLFPKKSEATFGEFEKSGSGVFIDVYPNPVTNGQLMVQFKNGHSGKYALDLLNNAGSSTLQSSVILNGEAQRVTLKTANLSKGLYLLRVLNAEKNEIETVKVLLQ